MKTKIPEIAKRFASWDGQSYPDLDVVLFHFLENEIRIVATDGHCMIWFTVNDVHLQTPGESVTIRIKDLQIPPEESITSIMIHDKQLYLNNTTSKVSGTVKDFPDYEKLMHYVPPPGICSLVNPKYLGMLGVACKELGVPGVYIGTYGYTTPLTVKAEDVFRAYIMPMEPVE